jgi:hypothetical protein
VLGGIVEMLLRTNLHQYGHVFCFSRFPILMSGFLIQFGVVLKIVGTDV